MIHLVDQFDICSNFKNIDRAEERKKRRDVLFFLDDRILDLVPLIIEVLIRVVPTVHG